MQQNHTTDRMVHTPSWYTYFPPITLMDNSTQSNKCFTGQKDMYIIRPPCPDCFNKILHKKIFKMLNKSRMHNEERYWLFMNS